MRKKQNGSVGDKNTSINMGDINVIVPNFEADTYDNERIEQIVANVDMNDDVAHTQSDNKQDQGVQDSLPQTDNSAERKMSPILKVIFIILTILPLLQLASGCLPIVWHIVASIVIVALMFFVSWLIGQYSMLAVSMVFVAFTAYTLISGGEHGLTKDDYATKSLWKAYYLNTHTPTMTELNPQNEDEYIESFSGKFVYYYKYGCKDCAAVDTELFAELELQGIDVISVETRTELGKRLVKAYPVTEVPAGLILRSDGSYEALTIYKKDDVGNPVLDRYALQVLFDSME